MSDSLRPHGLQHTRLPCPSLSPRACSNSWPLSWWCHSTISSSVSPFSFCPQSFPALGSFPMSWLSTSGGQSIRASASVLSTNIQGWFPLGLTGLISMLSKGLLKRLLQFHRLKASNHMSFLKRSSSFLHSYSSSDDWILDKTKFPSFILRPPSTVTLQDYQTRWFSLCGKQPPTRYKLLLTKF